jgi:hypothetical protein
MSRDMDAVTRWQPSAEMVRARAVVAKAFDVSEADLLSPSRKAVHALARQAVCLVARRVWPGLSYPCIAKLVARNDHSTVIHACRSVADRMARDGALADKIEGLVTLLATKPDQRIANAHVRAWQRHRITVLAAEAEARAAQQERERQAVVMAAGSNAFSNIHDEVVAAGVRAVSRLRNVRAANALVDDDADALRRKVASDGLSQAIAAAGGWR